MSAERWQPVAGLTVARQRSAMLTRVRAYFARTQVLEVELPALSPSAVSDPNIDSITAHLASFDQPAFLHTSPEYAMKRLLAAGFPDIGAICRVFRDGESGRRHQPEFTMVEWYRLGYDLNEMIADTVRLIGDALDRQSWAADTARISYGEAFRQYAGLDPFSADCEEIVAKSGADESLRASLGDDRDAWLDLLMTTHVAPRFDPARLTCVHHYPASQAALARIHPADPRLAERFEIFYGDLELANGYVELTDAAEQQRRFESDRDKRQRLGKPALPMDNDLLDALKAGLPPCAGVALGFDRLLMLSLDADDIRDICHFPHGPTA